MRSKDVSLTSVLTLFVFDMNLVPTLSRLSSVDKAPCKFYTEIFSDCAMATHHSIFRDHIDLSLLIL